MEWVHRHGWRAQNSRLVSDKSDAVPNAKEAENLIQKITENRAEQARFFSERSKDKPEDKVNEDYSRYLMKIEEEQSLFSSYLASMGVAHLHLNYAHSASAFLILPMGKHALNLEAKKLFQSHGTMLEFSRIGQSHIVIGRNTMVLPMRDLQIGFGQRERDLSSRLNMQRVSEIEILTNTRPEITQFMLDPENAILDSLRFSSLATRPGSLLDARFRISFRTGAVAALAPSIKASLETFLKLQRTKGKPWVAVAVRTPSGEWKISFPKEVGKKEEGQFSEGYDQIKDDLFKSDGADLFFIASGYDHFSPPMVEFIQEAASSVVGRIKRPNSVSQVLLHNTRQSGGIYYIHTHETFNHSIFDTTVFADQLKTPYDRVKMIHSSLPDNPFDIEN